VKGLKNIWEFESNPPRLVFRGRAWSSVKGPMLPGTSEIYGFQEIFRLFNG